MYPSLSILSNFVLFTVRGALPPSFPILSSFSSLFLSSPFFSLSRYRYLVPPHPLPPVVIYSEGYTSIGAGFIATIPVSDLAVRSSVRSEVVLSFEMNRNKDYPLSREEKYSRRD